MARVAKSSGRGSRPGERRGGRRAGTPNKATAEIKALAQKHAPAAMKELARLATKAESEAARVAAIKELFDRGYGKATQRIAGDDDEPPIAVECTNLDRAKALAGLLAKVRSELENGAD